MWHLPVVAPLIDTNGDGLIDERDTPAVIVASATDGQAPSGNLVALRGDTGAVIFSVQTPSGFFTTSPAVGDLDGDGTPESVTSDNPISTRGLLAGTLELSNGFTMPFPFDANGEETLTFPEQAGITWARITGTATKASGPSVSEFIVGGSHIQPPFLLNEGVGRLGNNAARFGFAALPSDSGANLVPTVLAGPDLTIDEGGTIALPPALFADPGVVGTHTAVIDWGGGTVEPGVVTENGASGSVAGSHSFAETGATRRARASARSPQGPACIQSTPATPMRTAAPTW